MTELLLPLLILVPFAVLVLMPLDEERVHRIALGTLPLGLLLAVLAFAAVAARGAPLTYSLGGFAPPLGVELRADGVSTVMMLMSALVLCAIAFYARGQFQGRSAFSFWCLLVALLGALNLAFLANDLFTLFVALELLTFAAVPLVCLDGKPATLQAALRYLMFALFGSALYLLGVALTYGVYGTLDISLIAAHRIPGLASLVAVGLMIAGLLAKAAIFPLHLWLPPAHSGALPPASAVLSALVVKAPLVIIIRLALEVAPAPLAPAAATLLGALGAAAVLVCGVVAVRQVRLKLLVAYSTAAQLGYILLMFPLMGGTAEPWNTAAWTGGLFQIVSHGFAKAAMFLSVGLMAEALGHDRISGVAGLGRALPVTLFAFGLGGLSLMGLPPSGGFSAKVMLLTGAVRHGAVLFALVILAGSLLAGGYVLKVVVPALSGAMVPELRPVSRQREWVALVLALCAVGLGLLPLDTSAFLAIGRAAGGGIAP